MTLGLVALIAGILTILAPCVLPVLPIIIGGSMATKQPSWRRTALIVGSLGVSIILFTLLLKATAVLLGVPQIVWQIVSGVIITLLGLSYLFPGVWDKLTPIATASFKSQGLLRSAQGNNSKLQPILIGAALGPVFSSCSPTYAFIVAAVLPVSFVEGLVYLFLYALGLSVTLFAFAYAGQRLVKRLGWAVNPRGIFRTVIGLLFVLIGVFVLIGGDKVLQASILESGAYDAVESLESSLR